MARSITQKNGGSCRPCVLLRFDGRDDRSRIESRRCCFVIQAAVVAVYRGKALMNHSHDDRHPVMIGVGRIVVAFGGWQCQLEPQHRHVDVGGRGFRCARIVRPVAMRMAM